LAVRTPPEGGVQQGNGLKDEPARQWPGEAEEASFLSGEREQPANSAPIPIVTPAPSAAPGILTPGETPPLEELVERIPSEVRQALDELFRAKFTRATRVRLSDKKADPA
jgi:hypothetical protein